MTTKLQAKIFTDYEIKFLTSKRGRRLLKIDEYTYYENVGEGPKTRWRCSTHAYRGRRATVCTIDNELIVVNDNHNHSSTLRKNISDIRIRIQKEMIG